MLVVIAGPATIIGHRQANGQPGLSTLREAFGTRAFTLTAEMPTAFAGGPTEILRRARLLGPVVDAVQVTDSPNAQPQVSALIAAAMLREQGIDPVLHVTCRDRNRIALENELLGAAASNISDLLLLRGTARAGGRHPAPKPVFDLGATELIAMARKLREGTTTTGQALERPADFFIGCVATVFRPRRGWEPQGLVAKADAGAQFLQTQLCFDLPALRRYMERLVAARLTHRLHVLVGLAPLPSAAAARWLRENLRGSLVPDEVIARLEQASDPEQVGVEICAELLQELAEIPGVAGANLVTLTKPELVGAAVAASGLRATAPVT